MSDTTKVKDSRKILNYYPFGHGIVAVQSGFIRFNKDKHLPFIDLLHLEEPHEIGETPNQEVKEVTRMSFENIESLEVVQKAIDYCREFLNKEK